VLYVVQVERNVSEWTLVGGYVGEVVTAHRALLTFDPNRGLARSILGRAAYAIDENRSVTFESAVRQNGDGMWAQAEYSQASGAHWRLTATAAASSGSTTTTRTRCSRCDTASEDVNHHRA
jgi:hypothetical protein